MKNVGSARAPRTNRQKYQSTRQHYDIDGNAALEPQLPAREDRAAHRVRQQKRRQRMKVAPMNLGYISFMVAALLVVCIVLIGYIQLQSDITNRITHISEMESELNDLKLANDETYTKIMSSVDLEEIKRIAINELGMRYAGDGQVITYSGEGSDYVRQYDEIPD